MNAPRGGGKTSTPGTNNAKSNSNKNRNNRQRQRRNKQNRKGNSRKTRGPPQSPQIKVMFRNIGNAEFYGSAEGIAGIIRAIVEKANERLTGSTDKKMILDDECLNKLIENDKLATQAMLEWEKRNKEQEKRLEQAQNAEKKEGDIITGMKELDLNDKDGKIFARPLYIVAPKKTRRRGEKPGNAYVVLTTTPIEAIELPAPCVPEVPAAEAQTGEPQGKEGKTVQVPPVPPKVDYSRQIAERQLALVRAVEVMSTIALEDIKGEQVWAGCQVEESRNGKSWRTPQRRDNREGTIEESPGFKAFTEMTAKEKEELQCRPKPAPGGGLGALSTGLTPTGTSAIGENGKPIATLVLHLQNKREQEKVQKKNKRRAKDAKKKAAAAGENATNGKSDTNASRRKTRRKKKGSGAKKADPKP